MTAIRVGIQIQQQHATYHQIWQAWQAVDATSADTLFNRDHVFPLSGDLDGGIPPACGYALVGSLACRVFPRATRGTNYAVNLETEVTPGPDAQSSEARGKGLSDGARAAD